MQSEDVDVEEPLSPTPRALLQEMRASTKERRLSAEFASPKLAPSQLEVWVRDAQSVWVAGKVEKQLGQATLLVRTEDGGSVKIDMADGGSQLLTCNPSLEADMT